MVTKIKYVLHPGYIRKGDSEYLLTATELARAYGVKLGECISVGDNGFVKMPQSRIDSFIHLHPDPTGEYKLPEE